MLVSGFDYHPPEDVLKAFASRWSFTTNTAILDDREMTPTLQEICAVTGLPLWGRAYIEREYSPEEIYGHVAHEGGFPEALREDYEVYGCLEGIGSSVSLNAWVSYFANKAMPCGSDFMSADDPFEDGLPIRIARKIPS